MNPLTMYFSESLGSFACSSLPLESSIVVNEVNWYKDEQQENKEHDEAIDMKPGERMNERKIKRHLLISTPPVSPEPARHSKSLFAYTK